MIIGTGIDIIEVDRVAARVGRESGFRELVFSKSEIAYCDAKTLKFEHYAARFAAKEAFLKAVGRGWDSGLFLHEIEVINEPTGRPTLHVSGRTEENLSSLGIKTIHLSISHLKSIATAIVIIES